MSASFEQLIHEREPWPLIVLHFIKVAILAAPLVLIVFLIAPLVGLQRATWGYLLVASLAGSILSALIANKWSETRFIHRAEAHGLDVLEARQFYRTYDWDQHDA